MDHAAPEFADLFPILERMTFLNHAAVAPISGPAAEAIRAYADHAAGAAYVDAGWHKRIREIKEAAAKLINARGPHEIAFVPNTTSGLALVANGIDWRHGDSVVITNVEYPANRYPWENLARRRRNGPLARVDLIEVPQLPDGRVDVDDVCEAVNDHTRVVAISHVQYASGHRIDLRPIADLVHQLPHGGRLCVDAIQSAGAVPVDVQAMGIDFLAADGHKWLLGPEGCGIFYCHEDLAPMLQPTVVGWMNMVDALNFGDYRFELLPDARRFEPGSYNVPGVLALGASLDLLNKVGVDQVWSRINALTQRLCDGLVEKGYRIFSPRRKPEERSGIVIFEPPTPPTPRHPPADSANGKRPSLEQLVDDLQKRGVVIVVREGRLRASPHFYNTPAQIDQLLDALP